MYFGNQGGGILEYDGVNWRIIKTTKVVRSFGIDNNGQIYVGLGGDFGYLQPDSIGSLYYISLKDKIPVEHNDFNDVWFINNVDGKIFFNVYNKVFVQQNDSIHVLTPNSQFYNSFNVYNHYYIQEYDKGLLHFHHDSLHLLPNSEVLANENINVILPYGKNKIIICTENKGIFIYENITDSLYIPAGLDNVNNFLIENMPSRGIVLTSGYFAVGTYFNGIIIFDKQGNIKNHYNSRNGLLDNTVRYLFEDKNEQLWAVFDNGISLIQNNLPFVNYTDQYGLNGGVISINRFNNSLYVGTNQYLYRQNEQNKFEHIQNTERQNYYLIQAKEKLLVANSLSGVLEISDMKTIPVHDINALTFCTVNNEPDYLISGGRAGLQLLEYKQDHWHLKHKIKGFNKTVYGLEQDSKGNLWAFIYPQLYKLQLNSNLDSITYVEYCSAEKYNFQDDFAFPYKLNTGEVVFSTNNGLFRYLPDENNFVVHPDFSVLSRFFPLKQDANGCIWFEENQQSGVFEKGVLRIINDKPEIYKTPFYKFADIESWAIYPDSDSLIYFGTTKGLLEYHPKQEVNYDIPFNTLIRKILVNDSLVYGGTDPTGFGNPLGLKLQYEENNLFFFYAATFYEDSEKNLYSYRLIGSDTTWSAWTNDHKKEYTNLYEGDYRFEVKSKNTYRKIGSTAVYSFTIKPPWYRSWVAYAIYGTLLIFCVWFIVKLNTKRLLKEKEELEQIVKERTAEVVLQKEEIEKAHLDIKSSINYASRIQSAVLSIDILDNLVSEHFILFKPRDIVSGDFYWLKEVGKYIVIVVADCTGHGVPGAFMSMLGTAFLNEIVNHRNTKMPGQILTELRDKIKTSLKQTGKEAESKDGMDMAIYAIDTGINVLYFAGGLTPLIIIRANDLQSFNNTVSLKTVTNKTHTLSEIKGNRQPVGIHPKEKPFETKTIQLYAGDRIYTFSDGYADQFGGTSGRKFLTKSFKQLLLKNCKKTMPEQKQILDTTLENWKNGKEQVDDILVVGVKI
jgi:serine phosphatase RsbU (regulator of sigma subunit)/ligand-binding sensor domain-containing protein